MQLPTDPAAAANLVWWTSLALGLVVALVVTLLLWLIYRNARAINGGVSAIWNVGQRIANNTIHIPALYRTNEAVDAILTGAGKIDAAAASIELHAQGCPGCPQCLAHVR